MALNGDDLASAIWAEIKSEMLATYGPDRIHGGNPVSGNTPDVITNSIAKAIITYLLANATITVSGSMGTLS